MSVGSRAIRSPPILRVGRFTAIAATKVVSLTTFSTVNPTFSGQILAGDSFTMAFTASHALGLYVIAANVIQAGDFTLAVSGGSQSTLGVADSAFPFGLTDGGKVFFLGLVDPINTFTTATFSSIGLPADFVFNIDDITGQIGAVPDPTIAPVPEPATLALVASGLAMALRRRRSRARLNDEDGCRLA